MATKTLSVVIAGNATGAQSAFKKVENDADGLGAKLSGLGAKISPAMAAAAGAVVVGVGVMLKSAIDAASELEQAVGGTQAVFGAAAGTVDRFSESAADMVGLSESAARTLTSQLGASLKGFGLDAQEAADKSVQLTEIGADLAATMGGTTEDAVSALGAAFRGEFDPLERFGIALKQSDINAKAVGMGLARTESDVSAYARGQAALALVTERAAFAQGQFARESDTAAGSTQIAKAKLEDAQAAIGQGLIPIVARAAEVVSTLVTGFTSLPAPVQGAVVGLGALAAAGAGGIVVISKMADLFSGPLGAAMSAARSALDSVALGVANMATKMGASEEKALSLATSITGIGGPAAMAATAGITAAFVGFSIIQEINAKKAQEQKKRADEFTAAIEDQTGALEDNVNAVIAQQFANDGVSDIITGTTADVKLFGESIVNAGDEIQRLHGLSDHSLDRFEEELKKGRDAGDALSTEMLRLKESRELGTTQLQELADQLAEVEGAYRTGTTAAEVNKAMSDAVATSTQKAADAQKANAEAIRDASNALREATDPWFAAQQAQNRLYESQSAYNDAVAEFGAGSPEAVSAYQNLAQSGFTYEGKLLDLSAAQEEGKTSAEDLSTRLQGLTAYGIDPSTEAAQLAGLGFLGLAGAADEANKRDVSISTSTPGLDDAVRKFNDLAAAIRGAGGSAQVYGFGVGGGVNTPGIIQKQQFAAGGSVGDGWFTTGEQGPELGFKSGSSVEIFSNPQSQRMLAGVGASTTVNQSIVINMPAGSNGADVVDAIKRYERQNGTGWRN